MKYLIKSGRINIRATQESDLNFVVESERDPENAPYIGQWDIGLHRKALSDNDILHLIVEDAETCNPVGHVIIAGIKNISHNIEFKRIVIREKGKGLGRETLRLVKKAAFETLSAHKLWLDVRYKNQRARHVYRSEGFIEEGILREHILYNGSWESLVVMSILKSEYEAGQ